MTQVLCSNHQYGDNTVLRVGAEPSQASKAGVFCCSNTAETTPGGHGVGTAYCGFIVYCYHTQYDDQYLISTGIGTTNRNYESKHVQSQCQAYSISTSHWAHCCYGGNVGQCPRGWGNYASYLNFEPGCYYGTYYPNPTPASNTNTFTGSL